MVLMGCRKVQYSSADSSQIGAWRQEDDMGIA